MDKPLEYIIRKFKDATGIRPVVIFKDFKPILNTVVNEAIKDRIVEQDRVYLVGGSEGTGKSTWCLWFASIHDEITNTLTPIDNITRNIEEFDRKLSEAPKGPFLVIDEGSELSSDRFGERQVKAIREKFTVMRKRSHLILICCTNPLRVNTYFREDRLRGVFMCKKRGVVYYYSASRFLDILPRIQKDLNNRKATKLFLRYSPNYIIYNVPAYDGRLYKDYESRKDTNIDYKLEIDPSKIPKNMFSLRQTALKYRISEERLGKLCDRGEINTIRIGKRRYITMDECKNLERVLGVVNSAILPQVITTTTHTLEVENEK